MNLIYETAEQRFDAIAELLRRADSMTAGDNLGASWNASLRLAQAALEELRAELAWMDVDVHGVPVMDGHSVFVGINTAGYVGAFNDMNGDGTCISGTAEACTAVMSGLKYWRRHRGPHQPEEAEHAALRNKMPAQDLENLLRIGRGLAVTLRAHGLVLRAEQRPLQPLCQGNYETVVYAVPGRGVVA